MSDQRPSLDRGYFEGLYAREIDPWRFRTNPYEREKYAATLAILPRERYGSALEAGCSIGVFTASLAHRCDRLLALDISPTALAEARLNTSGLDHVTFREAALPHDFPEGTFDLIVLSEVLYFLSRQDLAMLADRCRDALAPAGDIVLCHWLGATDYPLGGDEAVELFIAAVAPRLRPSAARREAQYRLDLVSAAR